MLMHGIAQVELNIEGNAAAAVPTEVGTDERHDPKGEQNDDPWRERRGVTQDHVVDDLALDERDDHLGNAAKDGAGERDDKVALVAEKVATETPHPALRGGALVSTAFAQRGDGRGRARTHLCRSATASSIASPSATRLAITSSRCPVRAASDSREVVMAPCASASSCRPASVRLSWIAR